MTATGGTGDRRALRTALAVVLAAASLAACASGGSRHARLGSAPHDAASARGYVAVGTASWYGKPYDGRPTANGERFDMRGLSGAHATLPLPSQVEVTNLENGRSIEVRINDRGPFKDGRIVDLSRGAAEALGYATQGTAKVRVRYLGPANLKESGPTVSVRAEPVLAPLPLPPPTEDFGFGVQAGAFADRGNAERLVERLAAAGPVSIRRTGRGGGLYRVVIGPWSDQADAQEALRRLVDLGFDGAHIVRF